MSNAPPNYYRGLFELTRLHKFPLGSVLLFWPYGFGLMMTASRHHTPVILLLKYAIIFLLVATLFHSAFCVYNDICDRDLDAQVARTKIRPLVTGVVPLRDAWILFAWLLAMSFVVTSFTSPHAVRVMVYSLPVNIVYPLTKRWTWWPQIWLGIACSWGYLVSWGALVENFSQSSEEVWASSAALVGMICWTVFSDTVYAQQDLKDDEIAGVKSTARLFGQRIRQITSLFALAFIACFLLSGVLNGNGTPYFTIGCGGAAVNVIWMILGWHTNDDKSSARLFLRNHYTGLILLLGMGLDYASV